METDRLEKSSKYLNKKLNIQTVVYLIMYAVANLRYFLIFQLQNHLKTSYFTKHENKCNSNNNTILVLYQIKIHVVQLKLSLGIKQILNHSDLTHFKSTQTPN